MVADVPPTATAVALAIGEPVADGGDSSAVRVGDGVSSEGVGSGVGVRYASTVTGTLREEAERPPPPSNDAVHEIRPGAWLVGISTKPVNAPFLATGTLIGVPAPQLRSTAPPAIVPDAAVRVPLNVTISPWTTALGTVRLIEVWVPGG